MNLLETINHTILTLKNHKIENPRYEAELIISHVLSVGRQRLISSDTKITNRQAQEINRLVKKRISGLPLQYLLGEVDFLDIRISVGKGVFIPRPETELMTEYTIKEVRRLDCKKPFILDVCTGSGCVALAIAKHIKDAFVVGTDISEVALDFAINNAKRNRINNVSFIRCDLFSPLRIGKFDLIVSNPPYIKTNEILKLQREVKEEPLIALDGGLEGLDFYRRIINNISQSLKDSAMIVFELGFGQAEDVSRMLIENHLTDINILKDYAGIDRIVIAKRQDGFRNG